MISVTLLLGIQALPGPAEAKSRLAYGHVARHAGRYEAAIHGGMRTAYRWRHHQYGYGFHIRRYGSALQCVPFARENSGIELRGNAATWWSGAEGIYERGAKPEVGSILNFRATGHMPAGHVAVVTNVINSRQIEIDHANWSGPGRISRDMDVVDVSPDNDWTEVRVALSQDDDRFGSVYPTYGFIYDRPDGGTLLANAGVQEKGAAPIQLHPVSSAGSFDDAAAPQEVAEAPDETVPQPNHRFTRPRWHRWSSHSHWHRHGAYAATFPVHPIVHSPAHTNRHRSRT